MPSELLLRRATFEESFLALAIGATFKGSYFQGELLFRDRVMPREGARKEPAVRGIPNKFPNVRTCFAHGCMLGMANYGRRLQGYDGRPDLFENVENPRASLGHKNLFFDSLVHDSYTLELLKRRVGVSQIIAGLDDPYPLGEMEGVGNSFPGRVIDFAVEVDILTQREADEIWRDNVLMWLG